MTICFWCWQQSYRPEPLIAPIVLAECAWCHADRPCYDIAPKIYDRCPVHNLPFDVDNRCFACFLDEARQTTGVFQFTS